MKKFLKFTFVVLILTIMAYSPNVFAEEPSISGGLEGGKNCGKPNVTVDTDTTLTTSNIGYANCYENTNNTATIELSYGDDLITNEVKVEKNLLDRVKEQNLTLVIKAQDANKNDLYTATVTSDEIKANPNNYSQQYYNVTVWLEKNTDNINGYNIVARLKAADNGNEILKATYKINTTGILNDGTYGVLGKDYTVKTTSLTISNKSLEVSNTSLFNSYIFDSKVINNTPSTSTSTSNNSSTSKEVVEFKQEIVSQSLSIPSSKYEDVIKDTIASDENLKDKLANGANVVIKGEKAPVSENSQNSFKAVIQGGMILDYVDIKINLQSNNQDYPITNLKDKIELALTIPPAPAVESGYYREYYVLREHDGSIEKLDSKVSEDGKTITFSSDKFSVYAVGYVDRKISSSNLNNPKTGDIIYFILSMVIISAVGIYLSIKRMLTNK